MLKVKKRNGQVVSFNSDKVVNAIHKAFDSTYGNDEDYSSKEKTAITSVFYSLKKIKEEIIGVEEIQDIVSDNLMRFKCYDVAKAYIIYRYKHEDSRFIGERLDYMNKYVCTKENAATASETDSNANIVMKNVANLDGEVYKTKNRDVQRARMKRMLSEMFPNLSDKYIEDLENHIIYTHDEASSPTLKYYCQAASLYPLMTNGVGNIDGITPSKPNDLRSFSGQLVNFIFLASSQSKGAVAISEYFVALNYYCIAEFGDLWYNKLNDIADSDVCLNKETVSKKIQNAFKQFVWGINQPAGNRSYNSPFTNISYYDKTYFDSLFGNFYYPDGTKPEWKAIDKLQRMFIEWFNQLRLKQLVAFPVETFAMVCRDGDIVDQEYKDLCSTMLSKGHTPFIYISPTADSIAACCRLRSEMSENTFNPTSGLTGVMTGSCNVITLNINRIVQDFCRKSGGKFSKFDDDFKKSFDVYFIDILSRVYKYHIAYKKMLYYMEDNGMYSSCNGGYIHMNKLYSTIGINGLNEAARFLSMKVSKNDEYIQFLQYILGTIKSENKKNSIRDKKYPFLFNSEVVPAESLGGKNYKWDKEDGYWVPDDENLYNSYFYDAHDNTSIFDKLYLHGRRTYQYTDGGSAAHINLSDNLSKEQYTKIIDYAIKEGTSYFTFNIPNSKCDDCGHIVKKPVSVCPCCGSSNITRYTRVIGYLRPENSFGKDRQIEASHRVYSNGSEECKK